MVFRSDPAVVGIIGEVSKIRQGLTVVQHYDTISVPLVYTQVITVKNNVFINPLSTVMDSYHSQQKLGMFGLNLSV